MIPKLQGCGPSDSGRKRGGRAIHYLTIVWRQLLMVLRPRYFSIQAGVYEAFSRPGCCPIRFDRLSWPFRAGLSLVGRVGFGDGLEDLDRFLHVGVPLLVGVEAGFFVFAAQSPAGLLDVAPEPGE